MLVSGTCDDCSDVVMYKAYENISKKDKVLELTRRHR
jgi:hypothetical protein